MQFQLLRAGLMVVIATAAALPTPNATELPLAEASRKIGAAGTYSVGADRIPNWEVVGLASIIELILQ